MDKEKVREIAAKYADEVRNIIEPKFIILFGSYVGGIPHEYSDIDIAVVVNDFQGDWLDMAAALYSLTRRISIDIEPHMLDETSDRSGFLAYIRKTGEIIYEA
ncbi:MAG: nucleotidyltransferase domain-containing protein [Clostridiales bacterium]|nr:nucleotidyltransferase domain-containing protein [Clostridiales bacterium]